MSENILSEVRSDALRIVRDSLKKRDGFFIDKKFALDVLKTLRIEENSLGRDPEEVERFAFEQAVYVYTLGGTKSEVHGREVLQTYGFPETRHNQILIANCLKALGYHKTQKWIDGSNRKVWRIARDQPNLPNMLQS